MINTDLVSGVNPMKFYSFCKVGGGFRAEDYEKIMYLTADKWVEWDRKNPPTEYIELGGPDGQLERPDVWIKPVDSVVVEIKAASVGASDSFKTKFTLRFPRFKGIRTDKDWESALSIDDFIDLKARAEADKEKEMKVDSSRKRVTKRLKKELAIAGNEGKVKTPYGGPQTKVFEGLHFCVLSEMLHPTRKSKAEIEQIIKSNGGEIFQSPTAREDMLCIGDKKVIKVASLIKSGHTNVIKPSWILDAVEQAEIDGPTRQRFLVPFEPNHMFYMTPDAREVIEENVDVYGDSYARDVKPLELENVLDDMIPVKNSSFSPTAFLAELEERGKGLGEMRGSLFRGCVAYFALDGDIDADLETRIAKMRFAFGTGDVADELTDDVTHVVMTDETKDAVRSVRERISARGKVPRVVSWAWLEDSWNEGTRLDEERFAVIV
jgi:DNA ligase 4